MIEELLTFLRDTWTTLSPVVVVPEYEAAGVLRLGKYHRTLACGLHWKIPVADSVMHYPVVLTTLRLQPQTCTTKDGVGVVVSGVLKFRIVDVRPYICGVWDQRDVLTDVTMGAILSAVRDVDFEDLVSSPPGNKVASAVRRQVGKYGFEIDGVTFVDIGRVRSLRLITHSAVALHHEGDA